MNEDRFWKMIEEAWQTIGGYAEERAQLARGEETDDPYELMDHAEAMTDALKAKLDELPREELLEFDRILERKLYDIDRAEIQEVTDGSDDGFLYCRGGIVALGRAFYEAVHADPEVAICDFECEVMCYLPWHLHHEKFGEVPSSGISRETCSNAAGWEGADEEE